MALVFKDRVRDSTATTGTGTITLSGVAPTGYQTFGTAIGDANQTYYCILLGANWEVGYGTYTSSGVTLSRTTVLASSNSGALVNFPAGSKDVFTVNPAGLVADVNNYNAIINGDMNVAQRGTSFAAPTNGQYTLDRYAWTYVGAGVVTVSQNTDVPTVAQAGRLFSNSLNIAVTTADASIAAGDVYQIYQTIEGYNFLPLAQRTITVSFWVKAVVTGVHCISLRNTGLDRSYVGEFTINTTATWEFKTVTVAASPTAGTWNYTSGLGVGVGITLAAGSTYQTTSGSWATGLYFGSSSQVNQMSSTSNYLRFTGFKLEPGSVATMSLPQIYTYELSACERYYRTILDFIPLQNNATAGNLVLANWVFGQPMRTTPSITYTSWTYVNASGVATNSVNATLVRVTVTTTATSSGVTYGSGQVTASAEL